MTNKILMVDDNDDCLYAFKSILKEAGVDNFLSATHEQKEKVMQSVFSSESVDCFSTQKRAVISSWFRTWLNM